jgi:hypothetical protein
VERKFIWSTGISGPIKSEPIYIHFDFDGYSPHLMDSEKSGYSDNNGASEDGAISTNGVFVKKIMCPPRTRIKYFFTGNGKKFVSCLN